MKAAADSLHVIFRFVLTTSLAVPFFATAQTVESTMNWETGALSITFSEESSDSIYNRPARLYRAERAMDGEISQYFFHSLLELQADSWETLGEKARKDTRILRMLEEMSRSAQLLRIVPHRELNRMQAEYRLELYPLITSELVRHKNSFPMKEILAWQPGSGYSGIVIYAGRMLAVHGERSGNGSLKMDYLRPAFFPVIYDENLRILMDRNHMDPEYASLWGSAAYSDNFDENNYVGRIGENPLRILATGLFGVSPSDPLIPMQDADVLLSSAENRKLLQEGRILIIFNSEIAKLD